MRLKGATVGMVLRLFTSRHQCVVLMSLLALCSSVRMGINNSGIDLRDHHPQERLSMEQVRTYAADFGHDIKSLGEVFNQSFTSPFFVYMRNGKMLYLGELAGGILGEHHKAIISQFKGRILNVGAADGDKRKQMHVRGEGTKRY